MGLFGVAALLAFLHLRSPRCVAGVRRFTTSSDLPAEVDNSEAHQDDAGELAEPGAPKLNGTGAASIPKDSTGTACKKTGGENEFGVACQVFKSCSEQLRGLLLLLGKAIGPETEEQAAKRLVAENKRREEKYRRQYQAYAQKLIDAKLQLDRREYGAPRLFMEEEAWQNWQHLTVDFIGYLPTCGVNGKVSLLRLQRPANTSQEQRGGDTEGKAWQVIHKSSRHMVFEVDATRAMGRVNGFSVGFAGARNGMDTTDVLTHFEDSVELEEILLAPRSLPETQFTLEQARYIMGQLIFTLKALESKRIVHRDIKPNNMLFPRRCLRKWLFPGSDSVAEWVADGCRIILIDYGLACVARGGQPSCGDALDFYGTPIFSPPEVLGADEASIQGRVGRWTHQGDTFAMGAIAALIFASVWPPASVDYSSGWLPAELDLVMRKPGWAMVTRVFATWKDPSTLERIEGALRRRMRQEVVDSGLVELIMSMLRPHPVQRPMSSELWKTKFLTDEDRTLIAEASRSILAQREGQVILEGIHAKVSK